MYDQYDSEEHNNQHFVHNTDQSSQNNDPAKVKIRLLVNRALINKSIPEDQPGLTIGDVCDLTGFKEGFVRDRLGEIVEEGDLGCIPGAGRRPAYYLLTEEIENHSNLKDQDAEGENDNSWYKKTKEREEVKASNLILAKVRKRKKELEEVLESLSNQLNDCKATERFLLQMAEELSKKNLEEDEMNF